MKRLAILLIVFVAGCGDQPAVPAPSSTMIGDTVLEQATVVDGRLSLLVPKEFSLMDKEMLERKYPNSRRPTIVYTNESGSINIAVNHTKDRMPQKEISAFHRHMDGMFRNLYPSATWFESGVADIGGRRWLMLDLRTPAMDTKIRNLMAGTSLDGRLLLVSFNVTEALEGDWLHAGEAVMQSLRVQD